MSFDIYGQRLRPGHCEVHPNVHEEYPCFVCLSDHARKKDPRRQEEEHYKEMERQQDEAMEEEYNVACAERLAAFLRWTRSKA